MNRHEEDARDSGQFEPIEEMSVLDQVYEQLHQAKLEISDLRSALSIAVGGLRRIENDYTPPQMGSGNGWRQGVAYGTLLNIEATLFPRVLK